MNEHMMSCVAPPYPLRQQKNGRTWPFPGGETVQTRHMINYAPLDVRETRMSAQFQIEVGGFYPQTSLTSRQVLTVAISVSSSRQEMSI